MPLNLKDKYIAFDTETTGLNPWGTFQQYGYYPARPFAFSFCDTQGETAFVRWEVDPKTRQVIPDKKTLPFLKEILSNDRIEKVGHNVGFDARMCRLSGIHVRGKLHDTLVLTHVITGGSELTYGLKALGKKYLEIQDDDEKDLRKATMKARNAGKRQGFKIATDQTHGNEPLKADYWLAPKELLERYAVEDAVRCMLLFQLGKEDVETNPNLWNVYQREIELAKVLRAMENKGVRVFPDEVNRLEKFYADYMKKQVAIGDKNGGKGLNYNSGPQKIKVFIDVKGYTALKETKTGKPSIDGEFLAYLAAKDPLAKAILEHNTAKHGINSFLKPYKRFMVEETAGVWVIHPNYRIGPVTGRMAASDPNLMQVAAEDSGRKRADIDLYPRRCFGPRSGFIWYLPDWSQIEVWIFAFQSQDPYMMKALLSGHDFHGAVAEKIWGALPDYKTNKKEYRKRAKQVLFCKQYGGGKKKVALLLDCSLEEASKFVEDFDRELPGLYEYTQKMSRLGERDGKIFNCFGRMYLIDADFSYRAANYNVQGSAADVMKNAMININKMLRLRWPEARLLLTLHDEFVIEVPLKFHSKKIMKEIIVEMQRDSAVVGLPVPLPVSMKYAKERWSNVVELCIKHLNVESKCKPCQEKK